MVAYLKFGREDWYGLRFFAIVKRTDLDNLCRGQLGGPTVFPPCESILRQITSTVSGSFWKNSLKDVVEWYKLFLGHMIPPMDLLLWPRALQTRSGPIYRVAQFEVLCA
jgi:hypothetical protein